MTERRALGETRSPENYQNLQPFLTKNQPWIPAKQPQTESVSCRTVFFFKFSLMPTDETLVTSALLKKVALSLEFTLDTFFSIFDYHEGYVSYVDYVLAHSVSPKIKKFQPHEPGAYQSHIDRWFSFAVEKKVENVELRSNSDEEVCALPECLYTCSSLITLVLGFCYFDANVFIAWKSLKSIKLKWMVLSDDHTELTERLVDVSSLVNAKLTFNITCIKEIKYLLDDEVDDEEDSCRDYHQGFMILVQDYLQKLSCASKITIGTWFTEVLCMLQFKGVPIPELKCKYLTLSVYEKFSFGASNLKNVKIAISSRSRICLMDHLKWSYVKTFSNFFRISVKECISFGEVCYHIKEKAILLSSMDPFGVTVIDNVSEGVAACVSG
ncbi:hypothetical protein HAX54_047984 [Datura stramonium]|uniref:Uncharacterized protein n=1 Tax=Datura stramonium TaxID=4076 RepID=A0ABS8WKY7_DATST|nr:hypothetical protein [Datura stramonium]